MRCRECVEHLYEYLDREVTPELEAEIRAHIQKCPPCSEHYDFETLFLKFVRVRCRAQGAPATLRRRILEQLLEE
jgi:mycothiol system anti-sigma-R factor